MTSSPSPFMTSLRDIGSTLSPKYSVVDVLALNAFNESVWVRVVNLCSCYS